MAAGTSASVQSGAGMPGRKALLFYMARHANANDGFSGDAGGAAPTRGCRYSVSRVKIERGDAVEKSSASNQVRWSPGRRPQSTDAEALSGVLRVLALSSRCTCRQLATTPRARRRTGDIFLRFAAVVLGAVPSSARTQQIPPSLYGGNRGPGLGRLEEAVRQSIRPPGYV